MREADVGPRGAGVRRREVFMSKELTGSAGSVGGGDVGDTLKTVGLALELVGTLIASGDIDLAGQILVRVKSILDCTSLQLLMERVRDDVAKKELDLIKQALEGPVLPVM